MSQLAVADDVDVAGHESELGVLFGMNAFPLLLLVAITGLLLGFWTLYIFFHVMKWLGDADEEAKKDTGLWIEKFCKRAGQLPIKDLLFTVWGSFDHVDDDVDQACVPKPGRTPKLPEA